MPPRQRRKGPASGRTQRTTRNQSREIESKTNTHSSASRPTQAPPSKPRTARGSSKARNDSTAKLDAEECTVPSCPKAVQLCKEEIEVIQFVQDTLVRKARALIDHLANSRPSAADMWTTKLEILREDLHITLRRFPGVGGGFIDISPIQDSVRGEEGADEMAVAVRTANLATLLDRCKDFRAASADADMLEGLLIPLNQCFPSAFARCASDVNREALLRMRALALRIRSLLIVENILSDKTRRGETRASHITVGFFECDDGDVQSYLQDERVPFRAYSGLVVDREEVVEEARHLSALLEQDEQDKSGYARLSNAVPRDKLLQQLETWATQRLRASASESGPDSFEGARDTVEAGDEDAHGKSLVDSDFSDDSDDDGSFSPLPEQISTHVLRYGPPSPVNEMDDEDTPADYPEASFEQIVEPSGRALPSIDEAPEDDQAGAEQQQPEGHCRPSSPQKTWRSRQETEEDDEEKDEYEADTRPPKRPRPRPANASPSSTPRRPLLSGSPLQARTQQQQGSHPLRGRDESANEANERAILDLNVVREQNREQRKKRQNSKAVQRRAFWPLADEEALRKAVDAYSASWSAIVKHVEFEVERSQQQVRDKARNMKVDFLW